MSAPGNRIDVDDRDPQVQYSSGWRLAGHDRAYNGTLHWATAGGMSATLTFTGTMVGVVGCSGNTGMYGWPSEAFVIDGATYAVNDEPIASPDAMEYNVTYFTSPTLAPGVHTLVVTNLNGTSPTSLWLDRFWYISSDPATGTPSDGSTMTLPVASAPSGSSSAGGGASTSDNRQNTAAIIGGTVGAAIGLLLLATLGIFYFIKRKFTRAQRVSKIDGIGSGPMSPISLGHRSSYLPMQEAPPVPITAAVPFRIKEETVSPPGSAAAPAPSLALAQQQQSIPPPMPRVPASETPQTSMARVSLVRSGSQATPVSTSDHQALSTSNYALLSREIDDSEGTGPPPYCAR
ncbi:uncharacterized protein TRAVEDRAFT_17946 [Trametes versicolor FP-101664 SS1]|uniref:uncharacterized protein n=1 Tax=Trametes versicolor (strain FP-101664) TaxID=717944 RepID=UPI0004622728|nr:uncharacterized protein TRAVEDRAFT_17946 [Trametes versicolor FP-101664 SS1]EIW61137.1 hypothetical protein TRAVEDRAFT_17946 [Trametes versicolor FP-101664 SS1]